MTREEEMRKAAREYAKEESTAVIRKYEAFKAGVEWVDNHPAKKQAITIDGHLYRYPSGTLSLFRDNLADFMTDLNENNFPKVTHENSPKKIKITIELEDE